LFPDMGNNSGEVTLEYSKRFSGKGLDGFETGHYYTIFMEGWFRDYKVGKTDSLTNRFVSTNLILGGKYIFHFAKVKDKEYTDNAFLSVALFGALNNVLPKDASAFHRATGEGIDSPKLPLQYWSFGTKLACEFNKFQFFVDMRHVFGGSSKTPSPELRGFCYNIGFVTSTDILKKGD